MSKLFKLKDWLTIAEAARHLSDAFTEPVTEADVLRLALDERLKLSVNFVNPVLVRLGTLVKKEDVPYEERLGKNGNIYRTYISRQLVTDEGEIYIFDEKDPDYTLRGLCEIPMKEGFQIEVERRYQTLIDGPKLVKNSDHGMLIEVGNVGNFKFELAPFYSETSDVDVSESNLFSQLTNSPWSVDVQTDFLVSALEIMRRTSRYCIVDSLPEETVFVVRRAEIASFISSVNSTTDEKRSALDPREQSTYLNIIAVLLELIQTSKPGRDSAAAVIREMVENYEDAYGISKAQLEKTFAAANRSLKAN